MDETIKFIKDNKKELFEYWKQNPDQRLTQMLFNNGVDIFAPANLYAKEDIDFLMSLGINVSELLIWGSYGKDGKEELHHLWLEEMDSDHILAILATQRNISDLYRNCFEEELKRRNISYIKESKYGKTFGEIISVEDALEKELDFTGNFLANQDINELAERFKPAKLMCDNVDGVIDTLYLDLNDLSSRDAMLAVAKVIKIKPDEFTEKSENIFRMWWD